MITEAGRPLDSGVLIELRGISRRFDQAEILRDVSFAVHEGELLALIGPSGCGKSTVLRILAGLIEPSAGQVLVEGRPLLGLNPTTSMVFQSFALLPWLSAIENVALPLEARGIPPPERLRRAERYLSMVGLRGHARAYPKELSGGMRQRVGIARALCREPRVLLMDEPFSALDVLTAQTLRDQVLDLWQSPEVPTKTIVLVTHSIEEAVFMADRVVSMKAKPGRVVADHVIDVPRPRRWNAPECAAYSDRLYALLVG